MATRVKHCGIARVEDAEAAVEAGAWALGMIFWPGSERVCSPDVAAEIGRRHRRQAELAGVFVNQTLDEIAAYAETVPLSLIQLHGEEGPSFCAEVARRTGARIVKAARVRSNEDVQALRAFRVVDFHLVDAHVEGKRGGTGQTVDWTLLRPLNQGVPLILSGGLTPENVGEAIAAVHPYAVDVASGTESEPGVKDHAKLRAFGEAVAATQPEQPAEEEEEVPAA